MVIHKDSSIDAESVPRTPTSTLASLASPNQTRDHDSENFEFDDDEYLYNFSNSLVQPSQSPEPVAEQANDPLKTPQIEVIGNDLKKRITKEIEKRPHQDEKADISMISSLPNMDQYVKGITQCKGAGKSDGSFPTILHWIIGLLKVGGLLGIDLRAVKILTVLALRVDPGLLIEPQRGETPLHTALSLQKPEAESLAQIICDPQRVHSSLNDGEMKAWKAAASQAAGRTNGNGETCVHLAIARNWLELARHLARIVSCEVLEIQRKSESDGDLLLGGGNTALHDAVSYDRCQFRTTSCEKGGDSPCSNCKMVRQKGKSDKRSAENLIDDLVKTNKGVLRVKNADNQTPYLLIRAGIRARNRALGAENQTSHAESVNADQVRLASMDGRSPVVRQNGAIKDRKVDLGQLSRNNPVVKLVDRATAASPKPKIACSEKMESFAGEIGETLWEMAFTLGGFKEACECLFVDDLEKKSDVSFVPVCEVVDEMLCGYPFIKFAPVMSQVHLRVVPPALIPGGGIADQSPQSEIVQTLHPKYLLDIFNTFRQKDVDKILKVTVEDSPIHPCTDEVIEDCLRDFDVRYLDWRKPDLCPNVLLRAAPNIIELALYSSGSNVVLRGWASSSGLPSLNLMRKLTMRAERGPQEYRRYLQDISMFEHEVKSVVYNTRANLVTASIKQFYMSLMDTQVTQEYKFRRVLNNNEPVKGLSNVRPWQRIPFTEIEKTKLEKNPDQAVKLNKFQYKIEDTQKQIMANDAKILVLANRRDELEKNRRKILRTEHFSQGLGTPAELDEAWEKALTTLDDDARPDDFKKIGLLRLHPTGGNSSVSDFWYLASDFDIKLHKEPPPKDVGSGISTALNTPLGEDDATTPNQWLRAVDEFWKQFESNDASEEVTIKLALIDDGVSTSGGRFGTSIAGGWPTEPAWSSEARYYHSAGGHGTIMADLIKRVCPPIKFYVAKLGAWKSPTDRIEDLTKKSIATKAAHAVEWATSQNVHIISMSWSIVDVKENSEAITKLNTAINKATSSPGKILAYCSAQDKGMYGEYKRIYPRDSDTNAIRSIGSADASGNRSNCVNGTKVDYLCPGEDLPDLGGIEASSGATALAAGLAGLILYCFAQVRGPDWEKKIQFAGWDSMDKIFQWIRTQKRFLDVTRLLRTNEGGVSSASDVVDKCEAALKT